LDRITPNDLCSYDHRRITFVATKCDDVDCKEVIRERKLQSRQEVKDYQALKKEVKRKRSSAKGSQGENLDMGTGRCRTESRSHGKENQEPQLKSLEKRLKEVRQRQQQLDDDDSDIYVDSPSSRKRKSAQLLTALGRCKRPFGSAPNVASEGAESLEALQKEEKELVDAIQAATREREDSRTSLADAAMRMRALCSRERSKVKPMYQSTSSFCTNTQRNSMQVKSFRNSFGLGSNKWTVSDPLLKYTNMADLIHHPQEKWRRMIPRDRGTSPQARTGLFGYQLSLTRYRLHSD
jgi:hypothetical protein